MKKRLRTGLAVFLLYTVIGLLFFASQYFDDLARMQYGTAPRRFIEEMTGAYSALLLFPGILWLAKRFPIDKRTWKLAVPITLLAAIVYTALHTTLMALSRSAIFPLAHLGTYDYGIMVYRYPMEAAKDDIFFWFIYGCVYFWQWREGTLQLQAQLARAQLKNLRLQLHPHFLFNTLNAISSVMYEDVRKADEMLAKLSDFLRTVLDYSGVEEVPLCEELRVEEMYVEIMRTRLEQKLSFKTQVAPDTADSMVPFMLLQPLIENSIKHGSIEGHPLTIEIDAKMLDGKLQLRITDDGKGISEITGRGHGLGNVRSRLEHTFADEAPLAIQASPKGGTQVTVLLPLRNGERS